MLGHNDSTKSIIAFAPVAVHSLPHGTLSREDMGLRKGGMNGHGPILPAVDILSGEIKLDKIGIVTNSKASSCIGIMAKAKYDLTKMQ